MEENKEILLPSKRFKKAEEEDLTLKLNLDTTQSLLRIGERDIVLDIAKLYNVKPHVISFIRSGKNWKHIICDSPAHE
jgi:hypothetical protein